MHGRPHTLFFPSLASPIINAISDPSDRPTASGGRAGVGRGGCWAWACGRADQPHITTSPAACHSRPCCCIFAWPCRYCMAAWIHRGFAHQIVGGSWPGPHVVAPRYGVHKQGLGPKGLGGLLSYDFGGGATVLWRNQRAGPLGGAARATGAALVARARNWRVNSCQAGMRALGGDPWGGFRPVPPHFSSHPGIN